MAHEAIWLVSTEGGDARVLSDLSGVNYVFSWSPDSNSILYAGGPVAGAPRVDAKSPSGGTPNPGGPLWLIDAQGQNNRPLSGPFIFGWGFEPVWSPDGLWIAFTGRDEGQPFGCAQKQKGPTPASETCIFEGTGVYIENILTGQVRRLASGIEPAWSPDGAMLSFISNISGSPEIWVIRMDGAGLRQVTTAGQYQYYRPAWIAGGR